MNLSGYDRAVKAIMARINIPGFWRKYFPEWTPGKNVLCPFHSDTNPSLQLNEEGFFKCHGCAAKGQSPIKFYQLLNNCTWPQAVDSLYESEVEKTIKKNTIDAYIANLFKYPERIEYLEKERGWSPKVLKILKIGMTDRGKRLTIPVFNSINKCICLYLYNVFGNKDYPKIQAASNLEQGMRSGHIWPFHVLNQAESLVLVEGHGDVISALSNGIAAVTVGSATWKILPSDIEYLRNKKVCICYDVNDPGKNGARARAEQLYISGIIQEIKILTLIFKDERNKDLNEWLHNEKNTNKHLFKAIENSPVYTAPTPQTARTKSIIGERLGEGKGKPFVPINKIRLGEWYNKRWQTEGAVISKSPQIYLVPKQVLYRCLGQTPECKGKNCLFMKNKEESSSEDPGAVSLLFDKYNPILISFLDEKEEKIYRTLRSLLRAGPKCNIKIKIVSMHEISKILISPITQYRYEPENNHSEPIQITSYFFGINVSVTTPYFFDGYTAPNPKDGSATAMLTEGEPLSTTLDRFMVSENMIDSLSDFKVSEDVDIFDHLLEYYEHCAFSLTGIWGRPLLHMAIDLAFHSPVSFIFNSDFHRRGSLDVLVFGDPACGKSEVSKAFCAYYEHGEFVKSENASYMGLVGGILKMQRFQGLSWGRFVMRNRDTLIIEELTKLNDSDFERLTTLRTDGIAQVNKAGYNQQADAICSTIWLSNTREGRYLHQFNYGVQAILGIARKFEDIRRFDYAFAVSINDVGSSEIHETEHLRIKHRFTKEQCHNLILWIKSRRANQIDITTAATQYIMQESVRLANTFHYRIPLIQSSTVRIKIAKIAAAIAGRIFSTRGNCEILYVTKQCVKAAIRFLERIYNLPAINYFSYSKIQFSRENIDEEMVTKILNHFSAQIRKSVWKIAEQLLQKDHMNKEDFAAIMKDKFIAEDFMNMLIDENCIERKHNFYVYHHSFTKHLQGIIKSPKVGEIVL